ncbi:MAG: hypothetical protein ABI716_02265 [Candidatus Saccharibacteria bacterium]
MANQFAEYNLDSRETVLDRPTHEAVVSVAEYGGLDIGVSVVDARKNLVGSDEKTGRTIIWPEAYAARLDDFETQRQMTIAEALSARVISVEMPGVGMSEAAKTTPAQKRGLMRGSFDRSADAMLGALDEIVPLKAGEEVEFMLFSQGVALGTAMIDKLGHEAHGLKLKVPRVMLIEAVNDQPWNLVKLLSAIGKEDKFTDSYLDQNKDYDWLVPPADRTETGKRQLDVLNHKQNISMLMAGAALRRPFTPDFLEAIKRDSAERTTGISQARVDMYKLGGSEVSRWSENLMTLGQLRVAMPLGRVAMTRVGSPEGQVDPRHPAVHSMPNIDVMSRDLFS